jgi:hypothetical protein
MATQEDQAALNSQTDSAREISNESSSKTVQREIPSPNGLYQPDSPAYEPPNELPHELHPTAPLSHPRQSSPVEHILAQNQAQESVSQQTAPVQVTETPVHSQSVRFTSPGQNSQVLDDTNTQNQSQGSVLQQFLPPQLRVISSSENARFSRQCQEAPVENTLANIEAQKPYFQQQSPIKTTGASIPSKGARISSPRQNSHVRDSFTQSQAQDSTLHQSSPMQPRERSVALRNSDADIYLQFPNRVMNDNHVENRLGAIREEIKLYEEFMRGKIKDYTGAEVEEQLKGLEKVKPFVCIDEVQNEKSGPFAAQPSRIVVLWRSMFDVPPTARLRDELVRFDLEGLKLPVVICGSLGYIILHTIFNEPDRLKLAEIRAGFECVKQRKLFLSHLQKATLTTYKSMARSMQQKASNTINFSSTKTKA